jgi:hypothetical protein
LILEVSIWSAASIAAFPSVFSFVQRSKGKTKAKRESGDARRTPKRTPDSGSAS